MYKLANLCFSPQHMGVVQLCFYEILLMFQICFCIKCRFYVKYKHIFSNSFCLLCFSFLLATLCHKNLLGMVSLIILFIIVNGQSSTSSSVVVVKSARPLVFWLLFCRFIAVEAVPQDVLFFRVERTCLV